MANGGTTASMDGHEEQKTKALLEANGPFVARAAEARTSRGADHEAAALEQLQNACSLPVAVAGALMPDAHVGYGLPIGGVLATEHAVIPYAVGVDIACRMKMTVLDLPVRPCDEQRGSRACSSARRASASAAVQEAPQHEVMDADWRVTPVTADLKDRAWKQLGSSGSGNHFVEFGTLTVSDEAVGLAPGTYLALLSHSGSRGSGAEWRRTTASSRAHASGSAAGAGAARVAGPRYRGGAGVLGGDGADGPLRGGQPRADPRAHRAGARRGGAARRREPPQLRVAGDARAARRQRARGHRASQGRDAGGRGRRSASSRARWPRRGTSCAARDRRRRCCRRRTARAGA